MKRAVVALLVLGTLLCAADKKRKSPKPPDVEVIEATAHRSEGVIALDGRLRNCGEKPIHTLTLLFKLLAPGNEIVTTQRGSIDEPVLSPGETAEFRFAMKDHARAVEFRLDAEGGAGRELEVRKPGPYPID